MKDLIIALIFLAVIGLVFFYTMDYPPGIVP
jgi:hypothetical protein